MGLDITGIGSIFDLGGKIIDKIFPSKDEADKAKLAMLQLQQQGEFKELELAYAAAAKQVDVNIEEAKSGSVFVSGWRPFIGWVCGAGLAYAVLGQPILVTFGTKAPIVDVSVLIELIFAMLGLGAMRTYEKLNKVASK
jgi:hypothetical protein